MRGACGDRQQPGAGRGTLPRGGGTSVVPRLPPPRPAALAVALAGIVALLPVPAPGQGAPRRPARGARPAPAGQPWWADSTRWPPGTFRRTTTVRPARTVLVGDTLRVAPPIPPAGLPDSIARDVRWSAEDPRVLEVLPGGVAVARTAGETRVVAWTRVGPTLTPVRVLLAVHGRLHTADGAAPPPARVLVRRAGGGVDTLRTTADGRFRLDLSALTPDAAGEVRGRAADRPVAVHVEPLADADGAPSAAGYFAAAAPLAPTFDGRPLDAVLVPRRWRVPAGTHAGAVVPIDLGAARARGADGTRFWRHARLPAASAAPPGSEPPGPPVGWPDRARPIPVAVVGIGGGPGATHSDSVAFWQVAHAVERDWGARLFRPAPVRAADDPAWPGITVRVTPGLGPAGLATLSWGGDGEIGWAQIEVQRRALLGDPHVMSHELLHTLGFGHVNRWRSVLGGGAHGPGAAPARLSLEDVAYGQLLDAARRAARRSGAALGLAEAVP